MPDSPSNEPWESRKLPSVRGPPPCRALASLSPRGAALEVLTLHYLAVMLLLAGASQTF